VRPAAQAEGDGTRATTAAKDGAAMSAAPPPVITALTITLEYQIPGTLRDNEEEQIKHQLKKASLFLRTNESRALFQRSPQIISISETVE
jgi:hypothetical protein